MTEREHLFRSRIEVHAEQLEGPREWLTASGDRLVARAGDWRASEGGEGWSVASRVFEETYERTERGTFRKVATVRGRRCSTHEQVATLEGIAVANPGDWILTNPSGESWPVTADVLNRRYELVE